MCILAQGSEHDAEKELLYAFVKDSDDRVSYNALWVFFHFSQFDIKWLYNKKDDLIDLVLHETHNGKKRLILSLLERQEYKKDSIRTDFLDYCLEKALSPTETAAVRALCLKLSYAMCKCYSDLLSEFQVCLETLETELLPPSLMAASKNIQKKLHPKISLSRT